MRSAAASRTSLAAPGVNGNAGVASPDGRQALSAAASRQTLTAAATRQTVTAAAGAVAAEAKGDVVFDSDSVLGLVPAESVLDQRQGIGDLDAGQRRKLTKPVDEEDGYSPSEKRKQGLNFRQKNTWRIVIGW